jgi:predicted RNase H-like HicB family nuclease
LGQIREAQAHSVLKTYVQKVSGDAMRYPICIEWGDETTAVGIQVPDIPGAITAGDTFEEAYGAAIEIAHIMLEELAARGERIPLPRYARYRYNALLGQDRKGQRHTAWIRDFADRPICS